MPSTICTPMSGRLRFAASELFLSVLGFPVSGSFGSFSQTIVPHSAPPQSAILTRDVPAWVSHVPDGSAASAPSQPASTSSATARESRILISLLRTETATFLHTIEGNEKADKGDRVAQSEPTFARTVLRWLPACQAARLPLPERIAKTFVTRAF